MNIAVIAEERVVRAFALAGIKQGSAVTDTGGAAEAFRKYLMDPALGVILLQDRIGLWIEPQLEKARAERGAFPMILLFPGPEGRVLHEDSFSRSVRTLAGIGKRELGGGT